MLSRFYHLAKDLGKLLGIVPEVREVGAGLTGRTAILPRPSFPSSADWVDNLTVAVFTPTHTVRTLLRRRRLGSPALSACSTAEVLGPTSTSSRRRKSTLARGVVAVPFTVLAGS